MSGQHQQGGEAWVSFFSGVTTARTGWPGSVIELLDVIGPLTDRAGHGGSPKDAFDLVVPSVPGYGWSGEPTEVGWDPGHIAQAWAVLMRRLGYSH